MEHIWKFPDKDFVKINVHCVVSQNPLENGNINGVGVIVRDEPGKKLRGAMGLMNHLTEEDALMAGIQAACIEAQKREWELTHIETVHHEVFNTIRMQEHMILHDN